MQLTLYLARRLALAAKRKQLRGIREHLATLEDQRISAEEGIRRYEAKAARLERDMALLESPADIIRKGVTA